MGVDYNVCVGLGKQIKIDGGDFPFDVFNSLIESDFQNNCGFKIQLTSQEYKGQMCYCTLFVGALLSANNDPRDTKPLSIASTVAEITSKDLSEEDKVKLDNVCESIKSQLKLTNSFDEYGMAILVSVW